MAVLRVPSEFSTIEAAQNNAVDGDTILIAPGVHDTPLGGITKAVHLKGDTTDTEGVPCVVKGVTLNPYAIAINIGYSPTPPALYIEGLMLRGSSGTVSDGGVNLAASLLPAGYEIIVNRCSFWDPSSAYMLGFCVANHARGEVVRLRNCRLHYYASAGNPAHVTENDSAGLHIERCWTSGQAWKIINSTHAPDTLDYVASPAAEYGPAYGEWLAPWFMAENTFRYRGIVTVNGLPPAAALPVYLLRRDTGERVASTVCDSATGEYAFEVPAEEAAYEHLIVSVGTATTRPLAHWPINPTL